MLQSNRTTTRGQDWAYTLNMVNSGNDVIKNETILPRTLIDQCLIVKIWARLIEKLGKIFFTDTILANLYLT